VETMKRINASFNRGDRDGALGHYHPDIEWRDLQHAPDAPESVRGIPALRAIWNQWDEAFGEFTADIEEYIDAGDSVVIVTNWRAKGQGSGLALDLRTVDVFEFEEKTVIRATVGYPDKNAALKAVGLAE
jgi:ketosteroid isomerase-like protein